MQPRCLRERLERALGRYPVVVLQGARRVGKSTLARRLARPRGMHYLDLGDPGVFESAKGGADRFLEGLRLPAVLDAVERLPSLLHAIRRRAGELPAGALLLVTGGGHYALSRLVEAHPERVRVLTLDPLTQAELAGSCHDLFAALEHPPEGRPPESWERAFLTGGLPELQGLPRGDREVWWRTYLATPEGRARVEEAEKLRPLLALLAEEGPALLNKSALAKRLGHSLPWVGRALERLLARGWVVELPAWAPPDAGKLARQPRLLLFDSGLAAHLAGTRYAGERDRAFRYLVLLELLRHANFAGLRPRHLRSYQGRSVELVLERPDGKLLAFAVRAATEPGPEDLGDLPWLRERFGERLAGGYLVHAGDKVRELDGFLAVPHRVLWP